MSERRTACHRCHHEIHSDGYCSNAKCPYSLTETAKFARLQGIECKPYFEPKDYSKPAASSPPPTNKENQARQAWNKYDDLKSMTGWLGFCVLFVLVMFKGYIVVFVLFAIIKLALFITGISWFDNTFLGQSLVNLWVTISPFIFFGLAGLAVYLFGKLREDAENKFSKTLRDYGPRP